MSSNLGFLFIFTYVYFNYTTLCVYVNIGIFYFFTEFYIIQVEFSHRNAGNAGTEHFTGKIDVYSFL